jgi:hypothetical protein
MDISQLSYGGKPIAVIEALSFIAPIVGIGSIIACQV